MKFCFEELQKIGSLSCMYTDSIVTSKNYQIIQFPLAIFTRIRENFHVSGLLDANELPQIMKVLKNRKLDTY